MSNLTAAVPTQRPALEDLADDLRSAVGRMMTLSQGIESLRNRIYGPAPIEVDKKTAAEPMGAAAILKQEVRALHQLLDRAQSGLDSIEKFV